MSTILFWVINFFLIGITGGGWLFILAGVWFLKKMFK